MTDLAFRSRLLRAPADRPAGKRGSRAFVAAALTLLAVVPLGLSRFAEEPSWVEPAMLGGGLALLAGALLLWTARRPGTLAAGVMLAALGIAGAVSAERAEHHAQREADKWGGWVAYTYDEDRGVRLSRAEAEAVPKGLTRERLSVRLGVPAARGIQRVYNEPDLPCLAYRSRRTGPRVLALHAFCFRDGRYAELQTW